MTYPSENQASLKPSWAMKIARYVEQLTHRSNKYIISIEGSTLLCIYLWSVLIKGSLQSVMFSIYYI